MQTLVTFIIQGELTDLNTYIRQERTNKYNGAKIKEEETNRVCFEIYNQFASKGGVKCVQERFVMSCVWYVPSARKDPDNIAWAKKFILDAMQTSGLIAQDSLKWVAGFVDMFQIDKKNPRVEIYLQKWEEL